MCTQHLIVNTLQKSKVILTAGKHKMCNLAFLKISHIRL